MSAPKPRRITLLDVALRVERIDASLSEPGGALRNALHDILRTYGLVAQIAEIIIQQRSQIQALTEVITMLHGRSIEHNKRSVAQHDLVLIAIHTLAVQMGVTAIAEEAAEARALLAAEAAEQLAEMERNAQEARALLSSAQVEALGVVKDAVDAARDELAHEKELS